MRDMKAGYLIYFCSGIDSVFDSQVLELLKSICVQKILKKVYLFIGIKNVLQKQEYQKRKIPKDISIVFSSINWEIFIYPLFH